MTTQASQSCCGQSERVATSARQLPVLRRLVCEACDNYIVGDGAVGGCELMICACRSDARRQRIDHVRWIRMINGEGDCVHPEGTRMREVGLKG